MTAADLRALAAGLRAARCHFAAAFVDLQADALAFAEAAWAPLQPPVAVVPALAAFGDHGLAAAARAALADARWARADALDLRARACRALALGDHGLAADLHQRAQEHERDAERLEREDAPETPPSALSVVALAGLAGALAWGGAWCLLPPGEPW